MLFRKIAKKIENHLSSNSNKIMIINGARQIGKSYIIRYVGKKLFKNYIEINFLEDSLKNKDFEKVNSVSDFYFKLSMIAGEKMKEKDNTLVFLDEIQIYPQFLSLLKFLNQDDKFTYIASGSLLGITLSETSSIPMGSIAITQMYPLDFEEFLLANGFNDYAINTIKDKFKKIESLDESTHNKVLDLFRKYLLVGGLPDAVNSFITNSNIVEIRNIQRDINSFYKSDAAKYDSNNNLKIRRIYDMIPSALENKKKRLIIKDIDNIKGKTYSHYLDEFDYLINSGIVLEVKAISNPTYPLISSSSKNLIKLYLNDVGILTGILYENNIKPILEDLNSINLGTVYENAVASELKAHGKKLYYYDNRNNGEVDFLIDDYEDSATIPIVVKSGKDYYTHSALNKFLDNKDYHVKKGYVLSNSREVKVSKKIIYLPIYYVMFI